jgi:hypothetical protein
VSRKKRKSETSRERTDRQKLELFLKMAEELSNTALAKKGLGYHYTQRWSRSDDILRTELQQPDEEDLRSFLMTFRKFVSQGSDVYIQSIHGIIMKHLQREDPDHDVHADFGAMNSKWRKNFAGGFMALNINGQDRPPEVVMTIWINGKYFHDDPDFKEEIEQLEKHDPLTFGIYRTQFLDAIVTTTKYIMYLANNLRYCLHKELLVFDELIDGALPSPDADMPTP